MQHADRTGHLARDAMRAVGHTSDEEPGMDMRGGDKLGQQQQRRDCDRDTAPSSIGGHSGFRLDYHGSNAVALPQLISQAALAHHHASRTNPCRQPSGQSRRNLGAFRTLSLIQPKKTQLGDEKSEICNGILCLRRSRTLTEPSPTTKCGRGFNRRTRRPPYWFMTGSLIAGVVLRGAKCRNSRLTG